MKHFFTIGLLMFAFGLAAQPTNDNCDSIIDLGPAPVCPTDVIYNNLNATESNIGFDNFPACWVGNPVRDVWFSFVAVDTILDYRVNVTACPDPALGIDPMSNPQIAIYRGDCEFDGLQLLECASASNGEGILDLDLFGLTPGITYFVRINDWTTSGTPNDGAFKLCVTKKPPISTVDQGGSTACSGTLTDSGGPDEDYGNNENFTYTICPSQPHNCLNFSLEYYNVEAFAGDQINFFDGQSTTAPLIGSIAGGDNGSSFGGVCYTVSAQSGCLTIQFISNGATSFEGFQGFWECTTEECQQQNELTVQTGSSPTDIVQSVVSGQTSITVTNIDCANSALATFSGGDLTNLGLDKGILLTSGTANGVSNPGTFFASGPTGTPGDSDLDYLSSINGNNALSNDACIVEMDVFASTDEITFEYIFGSEEYPEWVGTTFNDIFAFLVSGPGITGDPNIGNQDNVATLPDGTFIQINSVNDASNWEFYRDNQTGPSVAYDGLTSDSIGVKKSLTARIATIPCNTYHLKFAIADRGDTAFDSGVFISEIKGGSPNLGVNYNSGIQYLVEECVNIPDEIVISLNAPVSQPTSFDIVVSGTATLGTDYLLTIPGSVTFDTGNEVFTFPVQALSDGLVEGTETIIVQLVRDFGCGVTVLATLEIDLNDNLSVQIFEDQLDTVLVCQGNGAQLSVNGANDYFWQPPGIFSDPNISNPIVNPTMSMWVSVMGTLGLCSDVDSVYLNLINPQVNIDPDGIVTLCANDSITLTAVNNVNNSNLLWTSFFIGIPDPSNPVQTILPPAFFNSIFLNVQVELGGCIATDEVTINVDAFDFPAVANDTTICENYSVDLGNDIVGSTTTYVWTPNIGLDPGNDVSGPIATPDVTTTYTLIGSSATGICKDTAEVTITVIPVDVEIQNPDTVFICVGETVTLTNTNTTAGVGVTWTPNFFLNQVSPQEVVVTPPVSTWYFASLNAASCAVVDSVLVYVDSIPNLSIMADPAKESYCLGEKVTLLSPTYEPGNFPDLQLMWDSEIPGALTPDSFLNLVFIATETHTYIRTTTVHACTSIDSIEIIVVPSTLIEIVPGIDTICPGESVNLMVVGPDGLTDFSWMPADNLSCADCPNPTASPGATTTFSVQAEFEGCPVGASATLVVPAGPVFDLKDVSICPGTSVLLNAINNPDATYSWTSSDGSLTTTQATPTVTPTQTTTYTVTAIIGECVSTDQVTVTVEQDFTIEIQGETSVCFGDEVNLTVVTTPDLPGLVYDWRKDDGDQIGTSAQISRVPTGPNTYTVTVMDAAGCFTHTASVPIDVSAPVLLDSVLAQEVQINNDSIFEGEEFILFVSPLTPIPAGSTFNWYVDGVLVSTTTDTVSSILFAPEIFGEDVNQVFNPAIRVEVVTPAGCTFSNEKIMVVYNIPIDIPNAFSPNGDGTNDGFKIVSTIPLTILEFKIWNRWGQLVYNNENGATGWDGKQNDEDAASDVYIYRVVYEITNGSGKQYSRKGDLTLLR